MNKFTKLTIKIPFHSTAQYNVYYTKSIGSNNYVCVVLCMCITNVCCTNFACYFK